MSFFYLLVRSCPRWQSLIFQGLSPPSEDRFVWCADWQEQICFSSTSKFLPGIENRFYVNLCCDQKTPLCINIPLAFSLSPHPSAQYARNCFWRASKCKIIQKGGICFTPLSYTLLSQHQNILVWSVWNSFKSEFQIWILPHWPSGTRASYVCFGFCTKGLSS